MSSPRKRQKGQPPTALKGGGQRPAPEVTLSAPTSMKPQSLDAAIAVWQPHAARPLDREDAGPDTRERLEGRKYRAIPRTVETCNRYLDRLALVIERAGKNGAAYLPLVERLERELAEVEAEEEALLRMRARLARKGASQATGPR